MIYILKNIEDINTILANNSNLTEVIIPKDLINLYGILVIDNAIKNLQKEFSIKILKIILEIGDDHAALFTAIKLGYKNIIYNGKSTEANNLLNHWLMD